MKLFQITINGKATNFSFSLREKVLLIDKMIDLTEELQSATISFLIVEI
jgi:hypothetical protein|tara:strand:- start:711 stop:857 length:147 start_codon:yes stop_codon:yes gene_type:complete